MLKIQILIAVIGTLFSLGWAIVSFGAQVVFKILLIVAILYCGISLFFVPFFWGGLIRLFILALVVWVFKSFSIF